MIPDRIREQLTWKALCALDEAVEIAKSRPVEPSFALRFALAYLYAISDGTRWVYDSFWRQMQAPQTGQPNCSNARSQYCWSALQGILDSIGVNVTTGLGTITTMRKHNAPEAIARRRLAAAVKAEGELQRERADPANQYHG